jgi:hypothetical protein
VQQSIFIKYMLKGKKLGFPSIGSIKRAVDRELLELIEASNRPIEAFPPTPTFPAIPDIHEPPMIPVDM